VVRPAAFGVLGVVYILVGVLGCVVDFPLGLLPYGYSAIDNLIHLALGVLGIFVFQGFLARLRERKRQIYVYKRDKLRLPCPPELSVQAASRRHAGAATGIRGLGRIGHTGFRQRTVPPHPAA
jgi:hypothetical protein